MTELEICCSDFRSVQEARKGGAGRIELCQALGEGGLTPSLGLIEKAVASGMPKVNVLVRPHAGDFLYDEDDVQIMLRDIEAARRAGATGIVIGALNPDGTVNEQQCRRFREAAGNLELEFHRAFDMTADPEAALETIIALGFDRVLTSGCAATAQKGIPMLRRLQSLAAGRIKIMAGSGVNAANAREILDETGVDALHASASTIIPSNMIFRNDSAKMGDPGADEYSRRSSSAEKVRSILMALACLLALILPASVARAVTDAELNRDKLLKTLYAGMTPADSVSYSRDFYLANIDASIDAMQSMPWGKKVPRKEFEHFVLPLRVNNESLDSARVVFYRELAPRVKNMSMSDAALEVNHWCHEKVTYQPSDGRTSPPLSAVSQAIGRCGEESTFAVAALRSVGIPARQIYTPRWAHTDDNHAWVEVWTDGKWHFLGACEPEPVLDLAWFNLPASRGMLMSTKVAGQYPGPEEILARTPVSTEINVTSNYAPTRIARVRVLDKEGRPLKDAVVDFCLYNYAEFFKLATKKTDANGEASLLCGQGDLLVWASRDGNYAIAHSTPADPLVTLALDSRPEIDMKLTLTPPPASTALPQVTPEQRDLNNRRFAYEDSVRLAYTSTFLNDDTARALALELGEDPERIAPLLVKMRGNHGALTAALRRYPAGSPQREKAVLLLENISEKDLRDMESEVLADAVEFAPERPADMPVEIYGRYVLSPRIDREWLTPFRESFLAAIPAKTMKVWRSDPRLIRDWLLKNLADGTSRNPAAIRMDPRAAISSRLADKVNLPILFTALARTVGIPARIDAVTGHTQYLPVLKKSAKSSEPIWNDIDWEPAKKSADSNAGLASKGYVTFDYTPSALIPDPKYFTHYSISAIDGGRLRLLEFEDFLPLSSLNASHQPLDAGRYLLVTGQRLADGSVLSHSRTFDVAAGNTVRVPLAIESDESALQVIGNLNAEDLYHDLGLGKEKSILSTTGRGYYVLSLVRPGHEPSAHLLNDLAAAADRLDAAGVKILVLFASEDDWKRFDRDAFKGLPECVVFGIDRDGKIAGEISESLHLQNAERPLTVVADTFNRIVYMTQGYTIGMGNTLVGVLHRLRQ